jgi:hypothetical protein
MPRSPFLSPPPDPKRLSGMLLGPYLDELAKWLKALVKWITEDQGGGTGSGGGNAELMARSPSGGIAAGAVATVTLYDDWLTLGSRTISCRNPGPDSVPGTRRIFLGPIQGLDRIGVRYWSCNTDA